jgi:hypothetical protein
MGFRPTREAVESDAVRIANYKQQQRTEEETSAIDAYIRVMRWPLDDPQRKKALERLRELRIDPARIMRELQTRSMGTEYERKMYQNRRRPEQYQGMVDYGGMR